MRTTRKAIRWSTDPLEMVWVSGAKSENWSTGGAEAYAHSKLFASRLQSQSGVFFVSLWPTEKCRGLIALRTHPASTPARRAGLP